MIHSASEGQSRQCLGAKVVCLYFRDSQYWNWGRIFVAHILCSIRPLQITLAISVYFRYLGWQTLKYSLGDLARLTNTLQLPSPEEVLCAQERLKGGNKIWYNCQRCEKGHRLYVPAEGLVAEDTASGKLEWSAWDLGLLAPPDPALQEGSSLKDSTFWIYSNLVFILMHTFTITVAVTFSLISLPCPPQKIFWCPIQQVHLRFFVGQNLQFYVQSENNKWVVWLFCIYVWIIYQIHYD